MVASWQARQLYPSALLQKILRGYGGLDSLASTHMGEARHQLGS